MKKYPQLAETWIKIVRVDNNAVKEIQEERGLFNYKIGDILVICLNKNKSKNKFAKKRRHFVYLGSCLDYVNGNAVINLLSKTFEATKIIVITSILLHFVLIILLLYRMMYLTYWDIKSIVKLLNLMKKIELWQELCFEHNPF
jgi:hypothetical protein